MYKLNEVYTLEELTAQYTRQSSWSMQVLEYFWPETVPKRVLDVGCGPAPEYLTSRPAGFRLGLDIDKGAVAKASKMVQVLLANSAALPFRDGIFDVVMCHYLLLWAPMAQTLNEMWRVTVPGGRMICASEPDYYNRREAPNGIKDEFITALKSLGADPGAGGKLEKLLAELSDSYECGILTQIPDKEFQLTELKNDIEFIARVLGKDISAKAKPLIRELERKKGDIYMPVHFGCAIK
ncbi:class I SAM-dependent methyltransferase [[Eubacterium] cellulosolvens]